MNKYTTLFNQDTIPTIRTGGGNSLTKKHCWDMIKVKSATKEGFEEAQPGDAINLSVPNSATRRGRVGNGQAQTLDTQANQAVFISGQENFKIRRLTEMECERLQGFPDNWTMFGIYQRQVWINKKEKTFRIVEGVEKISRTQRYKMCGNAVTTSIVALIGKKLLEL